MCTTTADNLGLVSDVAQIAVALGMLWVARATLAFARRQDADSKQEREKLERILHRHREELIYQTKMQVLATLASTIDANTLGEKYKTFVKRADEIVPAIDDQKK